MERSGIEDRARAIELELELELELPRERKGVEVLLYGALSCRSMSLSCKIWSIAVRGSFL